MTTPYGAPVQPPFVSYLDGPLVLVTAPTGQLISLNEAKSQCRVDSDISQDDQRIIGIIAGVIRRFEQDSGGRQLLASVWQLPVRSWWGGWAGMFPASSGISGILSYGPINSDGTLRLPRPPLMSVSSIQYYDTTDTLQTLSTSIYVVRTPHKQPGEIDLAPNQVWPYLSPLRKYPILVTFVAGSLVPILSVDPTTDTLTTGYPVTSGQTVTLSCSTDGALPSPLAQGVTYYAVNVSNGGLTFKLALTSGGAAIDLTTAGGGGSMFLGSIPPAAREGMLAQIAYQYKNREPGADDQYAVAAAERMAAREEWGGYA